MNQLLALTGIALAALRRNLMRTLLTTLGIVIGTSAVIILFALGEGAQQEVTAQIEQLGSNMLVVRARPMQLAGGNQAAGDRMRLTFADADAIRDRIDGVLAVGTVVEGQAQAVAGGENWNTEVQGVDGDTLVVDGWQVTAGRLFTTAEGKGSSKLALIGATVAKELYGDAEPLGQVIRVNRVPLTIVGVLKTKGQGLRGEDLDDVVLVPVRTAIRRVVGSRSSNLNTVNRIVIKAASAEQLAVMPEQVAQLLNQRYRIGSGQESPFAVMNLSQMMETRARTTQVFNALLAAVASVSLLVGGIGVMNIMLVSVRERTREIGLRMAVGARPADIRNQFLVESVVLCALGGLLGATVAALSLAGCYLLLHWPVVLSPLMIAVALGGTSAIGILFGVYPAQLAARLDPIDALRHE